MKARRVGVLFVVSTCLGRKRRGRAGVLVALVLVVQLAACSPSSRPAPTLAKRPPPSVRSTSSTTSSSSLVTSAICSYLALGAGPFVGGAMAEAAMLLTVENRGHVPCELMGYPRVTLLAENGRALPFKYTRGHSQFLTSRQPVPVYLLPRSRAYVLLATYSCDVGTAVRVAEVHLATPSSTHWLDLSVTAGDFGYCLDFSPGQAIAVSPLEATPAETVP